MKVSRTWLQTYFDKPIPPAEKLAELFTFHSFEVEGVEKIAGDDVQPADTILDVKILPDRAHYCLSHRGVAEEISVLTKVSLRKEILIDVPASIERRPVVTIKDSAFCRRFTGRFVENIKNVGNFLGQSSLTAIGQRSISPIVDITNFVMFDIGQPTHAFDADKIVGDIVIRAAKPGEKITLLDGKEYTLTADDHVIADASGALDIAGVKGGKRAEVTTATRTVLLTSANFNPTAVRRTSTRLNLRNEASKRFENEITPELAMEGMRELSSLLAQASPQAQFGPIVDEYPVKAVQTILTLDPAFVSDRLGVEIPERTIEDIIRRLDIHIVKDYKEKTGKKTWSLTIPSRRLDLVIPEDIVEEVGRIYGYEHIVGTVPRAVEKSALKSTIDRSASAFYCAEKIKDILVSAGFSEVYLYTLVSKGDIEVAHPQALDKAALRTNLAAGLSICLEANVKNAELLGLDAVKIFEIGKGFGKSSAKIAGKEETLILALAAATVKKVKGRDGKLIISEALEKIASALGRELTVKSLFSSGTQSVCEIELTSDFLSGDFYYVPGSGSSASKISYKPFSLYPFIVRDVAVFVPGNPVIAALDVWTEIAAGIESARAVAQDDTAGEAILVRHSLFDTFKKDAKISYAFRIIFQSMNRTLTDVEVNAVMEKVYARLSARGWQVR